MERELKLFKYKIEILGVLFLLTYLFIYIKYCLSLCRKCRFS